MLLAEIPHRVAELGRLDALKVGDLAHDFLVEHLGHGFGRVDLVRELLDAQFQLAHAFAPGLLVVDAAHVFHLGADERGRRRGQRVRGVVGRRVGGERVPLGNRFIPIVDQGFEVELLLLAGLQQGLERDDI